MSDKIYLTADDLLETAFRLAAMVWHSGYRPTVVIGLWRGGTPIAIAVHELLQYLGLDAEHFPLRTTSYTGIAERAGQVQVIGVEAMAAQIRNEDRILVVDDVFDTGLSMEATLDALATACGPSAPRELRIATAYHKPLSNRTRRIPDYYVHETEQWLVFPHELRGLTRGEILKHKPPSATLRELLQARQGG